MSTVVFVVGSADLAPACEEPPCGDVTPRPATPASRWIGSNSGNAVLNQGAPHPTLGGTVGVMVQSADRSRRLLRLQRSRIWRRLRRVLVGLLRGSGRPCIPVGAGNQGELIASISPGAFTYFSSTAGRRTPCSQLAAVSATLFCVFTTPTETQLAMNDDWNGLMSQISWTAQPGTYVVAVRGYSSSDSGLFALTVDVVVRRTRVIRIRA